MRLWNFFLLLTASGSLFSSHIPIEHLFPKHETLKAPWFTGPFLTPAPSLVPAGHVNIEPFMTALAFSGRYDNNWKKIKGSTSWNNFLQTSIQIGAADWLEVKVMPTLFYNYNHRAIKWVWGDLPFSFAFKLLQSKRPIDQWNIALRIEVQGIVPFGKFQKLDRRKKGTDIGGTGSWRPGIGLDWGNIFYLGGGHFVNWRTSFIYRIPNPVKIQGLNFYGGDERTLGKIYPAQRFLISSGAEISITQNWVIVMEAQALWGGKRRFKGKTTLPMERKSGAQFSLAPAIEYNWSSHLGMIAGPWFTVEGRNTESFSGGMIALNYFN